MDLAEFLANRLNEDDAVALAAGSCDYYDDIDESVPLADEVKHALRHDPARVLREVAAGRKILALHQISTTYVDSRDDDYRPIKIPEVQCFVCGWASDAAGSACETLRLLAAVYSDHPDYREEWKP